MCKAVILIGGGGHAKVVIDCVRGAGREVAGILDDGLVPGVLVQDVPVLGKVADAEKYPGHAFLIAIGSNAARSRIAQTLSVDWCTVIHPSAVVSPSAHIEAGTVVMPRAVINAGARVGGHCIVNSGAIIEHDGHIADFVHISPGAALGGTVTVGEGAHVGIGAILRNNITVCGGSIIGAGAVVVKDILQPGTYVGVPAGRLK